MRLPNGFGGIVKMKGKRRKPYRIQKTVGYNEKGHPQLLIIGYTATKEEAINLLTKYNQNPYNIQLEKETFEEVYANFMKEKFDTLSNAMQAVMKYNYKKAKSLYNLKYKDIRTYHIQSIIDNSNLAYYTKCNIKLFFSVLDRYCIEREIIQTSYTQFVKVKGEINITRTPFSQQDINKVWNAYYTDKSLPYGVILIYLYTGFRISELLELKNENINIEEWTFKGGVKTNAGRNRIVPIHDDIKDIVLSMYDKNNTFFIKKYRQKSNMEMLWHKMIDKIGIDKTPHEARHTFESTLDDKGANRKCIDLLMGHSSKSIGMRIYTHKTLQDLRDTVALIDYKKVFQKSCTIPLQCNI